MKHSKRSLSLILVFSTLISLFSLSLSSTEVYDAEEGSISEVFSLPDIVEIDEAVEHGYVGRIKEDENNLYTFVFQNSDGTNTMRIYSHPVKYVDSDGEIKDISLEIEKSEGGEYITANHEITTTFGKSIDNGVKLRYNDVEIEMIPSVSLSEIRELLSLYPSAGISSNNKTVSYEIDDTTSYEYELTYSGFKEDIVVSEYTGQTEYEFTIYTNGLSVLVENDSYFLVDEVGTVKATIGDIIVFTADEMNNTLGSMTYETVVENQEYILTIHLDDEYLKSEDTHYPIRIDPTIEINYDSDGSGAIEDATICSLTTLSGTSGSLYVGLRSSYGICRALMRFPGLDVSVLPGQYQITSANVEIRDLMCETEAMTVYCCVYTGSSWSESSASWSTSYGAQLSSKSVSYSNGASLSTAHRYSFSILTAVRGWKSGKYTQSKGVVFKASSTVEGASTYTYKTFASYNRASYKSSLTVTYLTIRSMASLTNANLYYHYSGTIPSGYAYRFAFTPSESGTYSVWSDLSDSSNQTLIQVYTSSSYDDEDTEAYNTSGHSQGTSMLLDLEAGKTYYIMLQSLATSQSVTGNISICRGLPISGSEQAALIDTYNSSTYRQYTNCYTYALNCYLNPLTGERFEGKGVDPGKLSGSAINIESYSSYSEAVSAIVAAVKADCVAWGGSSSDFYKTSASAVLPDGYYKVALLLKLTGEDDDDNDYHWYRQVLYSDASGSWAHKRGSKAARYIDDDGNYIYVPDEATSSYTFMGYYAIKPPSS
ncbi:MAG: hypothetical protein LUE25_07575 [Clostridiales bacterium]|nr:hypothetical protein [Clostridiales bacterium]